MLRLLSMYGPIIFLGLLTALSFWLSPPNDLHRPPKFTALLENVRYVRMQDDGILILNTESLQQTSSGKAELGRVRLSHSNGNISLQGDSGFVHVPTPYSPRLQINDVHGVLASDNNRITLQAQSVVYNSENNNFFGQFPIIRNSVGEIRSDVFDWNVEKGLRVQGNIRSVYQR